MLEPRVELTKEEQQLLGECLRFYRALDRGHRTPRTEAQKHFIAVCRGANPETPHERAYRKYLMQQAIERQNEQATTGQDTPEYEEGYPTPGW